MALTKTKFSTLLRLLGELEQTEDSQLAELLPELDSNQLADGALALLDLAALVRSTQKSKRGFFHAEGPVDSHDNERRWRLHVHAASVDDMTFWVEKVGNKRRAIEIESGVAGDPAPNARQALENYWKNPQPLM